MPFPPMSLAHGKPIHIPPPPVPGRDQRTDDFPVLFSHQERSRRIAKQALDVLRPVRRCSRAALRASAHNAQYRRHVGPSAVANVEFPAGQVWSIALRFEAVHRAKRELSVMKKNRLRVMCMALFVIALAAFGLTGSASAKLVGEFTKFQQCPWANPRSKGMPLHAERSR